MKESILQGCPESSSVSGACARLGVVGIIVCSSLSFSPPFSRQPSGEKGVRGSIYAMNGLWRSCLNILFPCIYRVIGDNVDEMEEGDLPDMDSFFDGRTEYFCSFGIDRSSDTRPISTTCGRLP